MMQHDPNRGGRAPLLAAVAATTLLLAACSAASPTLVASSPSEASPSEATTTSRCALTPDASPSATVEQIGLQFSGEVTVAAGEAVAFTNQDGVGHTVTEGSGGVAADDACVNQSNAGGTSLVVTFTQPGDYRITCTIHPSMQTVIHVE